jgi:hypothetical protein
MHPNPKFNCTGRLARVVGTVNPNVMGAAAIDVDGK